MPLLLLCTNDNLQMDVLLDGLRFCCMQCLGALCVSVCALLGHVHINETSFVYLALRTAPAVGAAKR